MSMPVSLANRWTPLSTILTDCAEALERTDDLVSSIGLEVVDLKAHKRHFGRLLCPWAGFV